MHSEHVDSKCAFVYCSYFKEFAVKHKEHAAVVLLDDKTNVSARESNHAVLTNVRSLMKRVNLQESFMKNMNPVKEIVSSRLEPMLLKDEKILIQQSATSENV